MEVLLGVGLGVVAVTVVLASIPLWAAWIERFGDAYMRYWDWVDQRRGRR